MKEQILSHLPAAHPWTDSIVCFDSIDSTNTQAKAMAAAGAPHGTVVIADSQSGGRGRLGRSFCSPAGYGIYMSVILRPACPAAQLMHLTCAAGVAVCNAIENAFGFRPGIKWINDLVWERKKLGGILTELSFDTKTGFVDYAVVGIGINCNQNPEDFPDDLRPLACSAVMAAGERVDRFRLAAELIVQLEAMSRSLCDTALIMERYRRNCVTIGNEITVIQGQSRRNGKALSVNDDGSLLVAFTDGRTESVNAGEVSVRGLFGYS